MNNKALFRTGLIGSILAIICCFTPVLVWLVAAFGLAALTPYLDGFIFTVLAVCIVLMVVAWMRGRRA